MTGARISLLFGIMSVSSFAYSCNRLEGAAECLSHTDCQDGICKNGRCIPEDAPKDFHTGGETDDGTADDSPENSDDIRTDDSETTGSNLETETSSPEDTVSDISSVFGSDAETEEGSESLISDSELSSALDTHLDSSMETCTGSDIERGEDTGQGTDEEKETDSDTAHDTCLDGGTALETDTPTASVDGADSETEAVEDSSTSELGDTDMGTDTDTVSCSKGWYQESTGLCWEEPFDESPKRWEVASEHCESMGPGWTLPTIDQLRMLIKGCPRTEYRENYNSDDLCGVVDGSGVEASKSPCEGCADASCSEPLTLDGGLDAGNQACCYWNTALRDACEAPEGEDGPRLFWSRSTFPYYLLKTCAWIVDFDKGEVDWRAYDAPQAAYHARCVKQAP